MTTAEYYSKIHLSGGVCMQKYIEDIAKSGISVMRYTHGDTNYHTHDFLELVYILEGNALHTINGITTAVKPGDYFIVDYSCRHGYQICGDGQLTLFNILFTPEFIDPVLSGCRSFNQILEHYLIRFQNAPVNLPSDALFHDENKIILSKITEMEREHSYHRPGYLEILRCELIEFIILILRGFTDSHNMPSVHPCVCTILDKINRNYMNPLTLSDISAELNYSLPYLSRLFKQETGVSFVECLKRKRIENSCRLLLNTDKKVSDIAELVGYSDLKTFQSVFKQIMHTTPKAYQKRNESPL